MNDGYSEETRKYRRYLIIAVAVVIILVGLSVWQLFFANPRKTETAQNDSATTPTYTYPVISINNFAEIVQNLPASEQEQIETSLFSTVKMSVSEEAAAKVKDAAIRDGSYNQTYGGRMVYTTTFLVDIPSLKQTYRVNDQWSPLPADESGLYDYTTLVLCPETSDLIYEPFTCMDRIKQEQGQ